MGKKNVPLTGHDLSEPHSMPGAQAAAVASYKRRNLAKPTLPALRLSTRRHGGVISADICVDHPDALDGYRIIGDAIGSGDGHFVAGMVRDITGVGIKKKGDDLEPDLERANFALSVIKEIGPRDAVESLLATQMAVIHIATMKTAAVYASCTTMKNLEMGERSLNRLTRTFAAQVEALKRHRSKGEQRVIVERVYVQEGGQAVVGMVEQQPEGVGRGHVKLVG